MRMSNKEKSVLVPKLRFPEFQGGDAWGERLLREVCSVLQGYGFPEALQGKRSGKYPFCKVSDVSRAVAENGGELVAANNYVDDDELLKLRAKLIPKGATVFAKIGEALRLNRRAYVQRSCLIDNNVTGLKAIDGVADDYFVYLLSQLIDLNMHCGGAVPSVNKSTLEEIEVIVPGPVEQARIADCLSSLDELIAAQSRKVDALKIHKKGLMQQLFPREGETQPRLRFPEFEEPWVESKLEDLCESVSSGRDQIDSEGLFDLYGSTSIIGKTKNSSFNGERILVARVGANAGMLTKAKGSFGVTDNTLVVSPNQLIDIDFIFHYLGSININKLIFGSGQPLITGSILKNLPIQVPVDAEQRRVSACLSSLDALIIAQSSELEAFEKHKRGLMQQLFPVTAEDKE